MAAVHVYVRTKVETTSANAYKIAAAVLALKAAVEAAGGAWNGSVQVEGAEPEPVKPAALPEFKSPKK